MGDKGDEAKPASGSASAEDQDVDPRLDFLSDYILKSLRVKLEKWQKMMSTGDMKQMVLDFCDKPDGPELLVIMQNNAGGLLPSFEFPAAPKAKSIYFLKKNGKVPLGKKDLHQQLTFGDLSSNPLEQLSVIVDNVLVPLLTNPENQKGWPKVVSQDVEKHIHELQGTIYRMAGQIKGKTLLPMPINRDHVEEAERRALENGESVDVELKGSIEAMVIKWNAQVDEVLKRDSAAALVGGQSPGPMDEVNFWNSRAENLECIYDQMKEGDVKKMAIILEQSRSAYFPAFKTMFRSVVAALTEAQDICLHLKPLVPQIEAVESADLADVDVLFRPLIHSVCLVWANSRYYCTPGRIIVLLQQICNMVIQSCRTFLDPGSIFQAEAEEAIQNVYTTVRVLKLFRHVYEEYKNKLAKFFPSAELVKLWEFQPELVFSRFNRFFKRLEIIKEFFETSLEFLKLEKVEVGGIRGKALSAEVVVVFNQFNEHYALFAQQTYDSLDPDDESFVEDYATFTARVLDLERRLATAVCQAFDDCVGSEAAFKLITMCGTLLDRTVIKEDFEPKYTALLEMIHTELDEAKVVYDHQMELAEAGREELGQNMPAVAGMLKWITELKGRVENTMNSFKGLEHPVTECDSAVYLYDKYDNLMALLLEKEKAVYEDWQVEVTDQIVEKTKLALLVKQHHKIHPNFDPQLVSILREVKYLRQLGREDIPEEAGKMDDSSEMYRQYTSNLEIICNAYNGLRDNTLPVEFKLIDGQVKDIDAQLSQAVEDLCWTSPGIWEYIQATRDMVMDLSERVKKSQANIQIIKDMLAPFATRPLYERKEDRVDNLLNLEGKEERMKRTYAAITKCGEKIHRLVRENKIFLKADGKARSWRHYVHWVDGIVVREFESVLKCSLGYLLDNTDPKVNTMALMECQLMLVEPNVIFKPSLDYQDEGGILDITEGVVTDIFNMSTLMKKLSRKVHQTSFMEDLEETEELKEMRNTLMESVHSVIGQSNEYQQSLDQHSYLWTDDRSDFMQQFLKYGHQITPEEIEQFGEDGIPEVPPTLDQFKEQIDSYEQLYLDMEKVEPVVTFDTWFRLDCKPFKAALLNTIKRWSLLFKQYLIDHVTNSLQDLADFIGVSDAGLTVQVQEGNYEGLVTMMGHLMACKDRQETTNNMFEPLKETIELLKTYDIELPEDIVLQLQELPEKWKNTVKLSIQAKQQVAPLQANEVSNVRRAIANFELKQHEYRETFRKLDVFNYDCDTPYEILDNTHLTIKAMEKELENISASAALFEVQIPDFKQLKMCRKEVKLAKHLWDQVNIVRSSIDDWKKTPWKDINVENMDIECKKFSKDVRGMDKEVRAWNIYTDLEGTVKNMLTSLKAVAELQNPAIRTRHWKQLMVATKQCESEDSAPEKKAAPSPKKSFRRLGRFKAAVQRGTAAAAAASPVGNTISPVLTALMKLAESGDDVKFVMDENTTLADLLALHLHEFEDEVKNIVDKAVKEMSMEKVLKELDATWSTMEFEHDKHERTGLQLLRASEELIETLEDNQVQLQNLMTSKYISFFLEEVSGWQKKLSMADQVISIWFEVQRTWSHLESIFIGSEDIRQQLPEDSKRFEDIDAKFKVLVDDINVTPNVVGATNQPNLYERLDALQGQLTLCEKALAEYLETKRLAFPRFYFVSSADLLDILSNGNNPAMVAKHLTKLFDSMASLKFKDEGGTLAEGMYAKDGEYVKFDEDIDCVGAVEKWLNRLLERHRVTVRYYMTEAVVTYEDKPRDQWLFDYPAQVALTGTQIWWSTEVGISFGRLEEGYENALKDYNKKQVSQLNALITLLVGDLSKQDRQKITTICTIDVHSRDVVSRLITAKVESSQAFSWQAQLRHRWDENEKDCFANICDAQIRYSHEYLGNTPRLVITPLTDRCYITLTQSLHLIMGGAPAGPAGTGKTETTKDLGRALGVMVYVFNCSEQMDYKSCGNIYKGLAQTGAWGCFDEFNRISVEVLSVVAVQVKAVQDAIRDKKEEFNFLGDVIVCKPSVGLFITMNPGYAGRTELPENLKALFRPCAMVVPDIELICEIMLVAEGFQDARLLARKFITLYTLCKELLSKQDHYDWGLRAVKSVLVVAGSLKRSDRGRPEDQVLMRALRDFNVPKIVTDDVPVFMGLIFDLFPALDVPRKRDMELERSIKKACIDLHLQPEDGFTLKVVQLQELLDVRHSVFIIGNAGTGKTQVWKTLFKTHQNLKRKPHFNDLNPKAVTNDELFGIINPATREWKDGLLSTIMRDQANLTTDGPRWIILDGDIDPMWIESLNTVMDDNKVLTLASNERIALTPSMRLLFEIATLKHATPATVSRAGILYLNPADLGWNPFVNSWIETRDIQSEKANLMILFDKYVPGCLEAMRTRVKKITPLPEISQIQMLCNLLDCMLTPETVPADSPKELYELYFCFCCVTAFGASMFPDQMTDYRVEFSRWWVNEFKSVKFPAAGTVFDYYIDTATQKFVPWSQNVASFELDPDIPLQAVQVPTPETSRLRFFMDRLMEKRHPVMLVGPPGSGKTVLINDKLGQLSDDYLVTRVPFNFYTTSEMLQRVLERPLEKKAGRNFGPPGSKRMVYFIDDMNMPEVDLYDTVQPHTMLRQHMDYQHWYDRTKLSLKEIHNVQYVAAMNPTAGSFTINPRLQRHFAVFATCFPGAESLHTIYNSILHQHLSCPLNKFTHPIVKMTTSIVQAAFTLHGKVSQTFLPTAIKFHYVFNLRDLSNIFQGLLFCTHEAVKQPIDLIRVWLHESDRVYGDKLVDDEDATSFGKILLDIVKKGFENEDETVVMQKPNIWCHFAKGIGDPKYHQIPGWPDLTKLLNEGMEGYNEINAAMNLVLFEDAMMHVCRINRILESPRGNALLVGVGGSGKQSLSRLAAFISGLEVFQVTLKKGYAIPDLKADLAALYQKAGLKNVGMVFLMTDSQVADESFLVLINDLLASGEIPDLFADDEQEEIINAVRNEVKAAGMQDTRDNCWHFYIDKVRRTLKVVLCFSPVGTTLRVRARKFPALINCSNIDWFHEWPHEALVSVSQRFLSEVKELPPEIAPKAAEFMAQVHLSVNDMSKIYLANDKRYNYTTPKSFLEQIALYGKLLKFNVEDLASKILRLENGLEKLESTSSQVDDLKEKLASQEVELKIKNEDADRLIQVVGKETETVTKEKNIADEEEKKVGVIAIEVGKKQHECEADLAKAEPALVAAQAALDTLNKNNLTELKSFGSPPPAVVNVTAAVMVLLAPNGKVPRDRSWKACKVMMAKVDGFIDQLKHYDKEHIHPECLKQIKPYLADPQFNPDFIRSKSGAASGLCAWVINIIRFYEVFCEVEPKRLALEAANADLAAASEKLAGIKARVVELESMLGELTASFEEATAAKMKCQKEADATAYVIDLANRLVGGLASENVRWGESVKSYKESEITIPGDVLVVTAFISYVGCFTKVYRTSLLEKSWIPTIAKLEITMTPELDPLSLLTDEAQIATWNNEGLPNDRMSAENATILTNSERWPLMIDPQLQGIKWIKTKYGADLKVIRLGQRGYMDAVEAAISDGAVVLIENIGESVDPVLDPLLARNLIRKGTAIKLGDKEVEYNPTFRLILHTKLANPHYKPEMQAQTTLINFTVTRDGLEDQLLAEVVKAERPDLEEQKYNLTKQQNEFKILLKKLEDNLLSRLSSAGGNFLGDTELVENLEFTKATAAEVQAKVIEGRETSIKIDEARELYRPAATRASLLYFILNDLHKINPIYQFSLKAFSVVFHKAMTKAEPAEDVKSRVENLIDIVTYSVFMYTTRGLFEVDKLIFTAQMVFQILLTAKEIQFSELDFLLRFPITPNVTSPVDFLTDTLWGAIKSLSSMDEFKNLDRDIEGSAKRWKSLCESECPEKEKFPQEWKNKTPLQRLCMMRALRPDRMTYAVRAFVEERMGFKYVEGKTVEFAKSFEESGPSTPIFFILSPGVDPLKDVEALGKKMKFTFDHKNFHSVSLGQGQEVVAEAALDTAAKHGHWVILQNIHLVKNWLPRLEKRLEVTSQTGHRKYRVYMSAEPAGTPEAHIIPQGILESAIKITNEPPTGMFANLHKALDNFNQDTMEMCTKEAEFKSILFSLCYFHAVVAERRKFGPQGWNRNYPFNVGDLTISVNVLYNYLEANSKVPWEDLRYLFGEIMYGGHITDDWDRRLCRTYLEVYMAPEQLEGDLFFAPGFPSPPNSDYKGYHGYINENLPPESPYLYGLHPNAEIGFLTATSNSLFRTVFELQPRDTGGGGGVTVTREEKVKQILDDIVEKLPDEFNMAEIMGKVEDRTPYVVVAFQECERMNMLTGEIRRSLKELDLGLKGELTITSDMEDLSNSLFMDTVAASWEKRAYPSMNGLTVWYMDLLLRVRELENWTSDFQLPASVWLAGFFNPQSFLTAIMQSTARKNEWPLDRMCLQCDVTKKNKEDFSSAPREGAYVHGLFMEGARWDTSVGSICDSKLKELYPMMPVIFIKAMTQDKQDTRNIYECPVYKTRMRGPTFVWTFNLKTKEKASKWVLAGVALLLQV